MVDDCFTHFRLICREEIRDVMDVTFENRDSTIQPARTGLHTEIGIWPWQSGFSRQKMEGFASKGKEMLRVNNGLFKGNHRWLEQNKSRCLPEKQGLLPTKIGSNDLSSLGFAHPFLDVLHWTFLDLLWPTDCRETMTFIDVLNVFFLTWMISEVRVTGSTSGVFPEAGSVYSKAKDN